MPIPGQHINDRVHFERKGLYNIKKAAIGSLLWRRIASTPEFDS